MLETSEAGTVLRATQPPDGSAWAATWADPGPGPRPPRGARTCPPGLSPAGPFRPFTRSTGFSTSIAPTLPRGSGLQGGRGTGTPASPAPWAANEAWSRFPMKRPQSSIVGPLPSDWWESYLKRTIWSLRHPRAVWSPVTVKITPSERRGRPATSPARAVGLAGSSRSEKAPDPPAKETVLRALRECKKGRPSLEGPPSLSPERPDSQWRSPNARPSAFKPLIKSGELASSVPGLGPLKRSAEPRGSQRSSRRRPRPAPASSPAAGPFSSGRNAIASSYSSSGALREPWKGRVPCASLQMPEWPLKKRKSRRCRSSGSPASEEPPEASGSTAQQNEEVPQLLSRPETLSSLSPPPQLDGTVPSESPALGRKAGFQRSRKTGKVTTKVTADPVPDTRSAIRPCSPATPPSAGAAATRGTSPQLASAGLRVSPRCSEEGVGAARAPLETATPPAPLGCSQAERLLGPSWHSKATAAVTLLTPVPPASPVPDTTQPPPACQAARSARPPDPAAVPPVAPSAQRTLPGTVKRPACRLSLPAPLAATPADPTAKPIWGLPSNSEAGDTLPSRISAATAAYSPPGVSVPTFEPVFGSAGPLQTPPAVAPFSSKQTSLPASPASAHLLHDLVKATPAAQHSAPASTSRDSPSRPPLDVCAAGVTGATGSTHSVPAACHPCLLGASHAFRASSSPVTGFISRYPQDATASVGNTGEVFSQVLPRAIQISPRKSTADFKGKGGALSASALRSTTQPALSSGASHLISAFTVPFGSDSKPPFPRSLGATPQHTLGASGGQKQEAPQTALGPSMNSSSVFRNSTVAPPTPTSAPAQSAFSSPSQSAPGVLTPSASASQIPASKQPDVGSTPAGFPFARAAATGFRVAAQTHQSGACGCAFGSAAPRPFAFGGLVTPMDCGEPGGGITVPDASPHSGVFSLRAMPSGATPFGKGWDQNAQGLTSQRTPLDLVGANPCARKVMFGGPPMAPLAQSIHVPRPVKTGSSLGFGIPSPSAQGSTGRGSLRSPAPSFSIGAKPKTPKNREQGHSRRHHAYKK